MPRSIVLIGILLFVTSRGSAQQEVADRTPPETSKASTQYMKVYAEFQADEAKLRAEMTQASEPPANRRKRLTALREAYGMRCLEIAKANPEDEDAYSPLLWIVVEVKEGKSLDCALVTLKERFSTRSHLWLMIPELDHSRSVEIVPFLRSVVERSPDSTSQGAACFAWGIHLKRKAERSGNQQFADESVKLFERVLRDFRDEKARRVLPLGEAAKRELEDLRGPLGVGHVAPDMEGEDVDGGKFNLKDYRGKVVLISFSGRWCGPCRAMYPQERALVERLAGQPFAFISICSNDDKMALKQHVNEEKLTWKCVWDGKGTSGPIAAAWHVEEWPMFYALDQQGVIRYKSIEPPDGTLAQWAEKLLKKPIP